MTITEDKSSELEINCFTYNNIAVDIENKINFDEFGPNTLYNYQVDYQTLDRQTKCGNYNIWIKSTNAPAIVTLCSASEKSKKSFVFPPF